MESGEVIFTAKKGIARIVVNRPDKRNALNIATRKKLLEIMETVKQDEAIRVLMITGAGEKSFIAGADLNELKDFNPIQILKYLDTYSQKLYTEFERLPIPTIAVIKGYCLGGGCELAMACDLRIASPGAKFGLPELRHAIIPGAGGTQRLVRLVGLGRAKELILTSDIIDAKEAERIGLINKVVPKNRIEKYVKALADKILSLGPVAVRMAKAALNQSVQGSLDMGMRIDALSEAVCYATRDKQEGVYAFLEKRKPRFTNE
jgi:enoyl-CoA hydratase/carnithine racemase